MRIWQKRMMGICMMVAMVLSQIGVSFGQGEGIEIVKEITSIKEQAGTENNIIGVDEGEVIEGGSTSKEEVIEGVSASKEEVVAEERIAEVFDGDLAALSLREQAAVRERMAKMGRAVGNENEPFLIGTAEHLAELAELVNGGAEYSVGPFAEATYQQVADIDLSGIANWTPIGTYGNPFQGTFDGHGHVITGLQIDSSNSYVGLFGYVEGGAIRNVGLEAFTVTGNNTVGRLVGYSRNGSSISKCYATGTVTGEKCVEGLVGQSSGGSIENSVALNETVSGNENVGKVVGKDRSSVTDCYGWSDMKGKDDTGVETDTSVTELYFENGFYTKDAN